MAFGQLIGTTEFAVHQSYLESNLLLEALHDIVAMGDDFVNTGCSFLASINSWWHWAAEAVLWVQVGSHSKSEIFIVFDIEGN